MALGKKQKKVPEAIRKATQVAMKNMINVPVESGTIPHEILGEYDAGKILFKPAGDGTGFEHLVLAVVFWNLLVLTMF